MLPLISPRNDFFIILVSGIPEIMQVISNSLSLLCSFSTLPNLPLRLRLWLGFSLTLYLLYHLHTCLVLGAFFAGTFFSATLGLDLDFFSSLTGASFLIFLSASAFFFFSVSYALALNFYSFSFCFCSSFILFCSSCSSFFFFS